MTQTRPADDQLSRINIERLYTHVSQHQIERIIQIISRWELPGKEYAKRYLQ